MDKQEAGTSASSTKINAIGPDFQMLLIAFISRFPVM